MSSSIDYLIGQQDQSGGWGYRAGQRPVVEPTATVLLAIRDSISAQDAFQNGIAWLIDCQNQDGGWGINERDMESGWQTAWALLSLGFSDQHDDVIARGKEWLQSVGNYKFRREDFQNQEINTADDNTSLIWPWLPDQGVWIEPTAMAVMALADDYATSKMVKPRIEAAIRYFHQYRTPTGGWDQGNAGELDTLVFPRAYQTALVLMALTRVAPQDILVVDITGLKQDIRYDQGVLAISAGLLALRTMGQNGDTLIRSLSKLQFANGSWGDNILFSSWATMALRGYL